MFSSAPPSSSMVDPSIIAHAVTAPPLMAPEGGEDDPYRTAIDRPRGSGDLVLTALKSSIDLVLFEAIDVQGIGRGKLVPAPHASRVYLSTMHDNNNEGDEHLRRENLSNSILMLFAGATVVGPRRIHAIQPDVMKKGCPNTKLIPIWETMRMMPHLSSQQSRVARVLCNHAGIDNKDHVPCAPRVLLEKMLAALAACEGGGTKVLSAFEYEFTLVAASSSPEHSENVVLRPIMRGTDVFASMRSVELLKYFAGIERALRSTGIDVLTMNTEYGAGPQLEITYAPSWDTMGGDIAWQYKRVVKEWTRLHAKSALSATIPIHDNEQLLATFMCRPFFQQLGLDFYGGASCGGHLNFSLWSKDRSSNLMEDERHASGLSSIARRFLAGVLEHASALSAFAAPTIDSYWRVTSGSWAPTRACWGIENRTCMIRFISASNGDGRGARFEWRQPSSAANPYLALATFVAAGIDGIQRGLTPPNPVVGDAYSLDDGCGLDLLPTSLTEAIEALKDDEKLHAILGDDFVQWYLHSVETEELQTCPRMYRQSDSRVAHGVLTNNLGEIDKVRRLWGSADDGSLINLTNEEIAQRSAGLADWCVQQYAELR